MRFPLTLRLMFHSFRAGWLAIMITLLGWIWLVPATPEESAALGTSTARPAGLTQLRIARGMVRFAPKRSAQLLAHASGGDVSPEFAAMILRDIAAGKADPPGSAPAKGPQGSKFIAAPEGAATSP